MASPIKDIPNLYGASPTFVAIKPPPVFPDRHVQATDAQTYLAEQARIAQAKSDCETQGGVYDGGNCVFPPPPPPVYVAPVRQAYTAPQTTYSSNGGSLTGSLGYSLAYGNCVDEAGVNKAPGNPISWASTSQSGWLGASVLFYFNHVAVQTGYWSNGDIEVRQQNSPGMAHRIPRSEIRGFR